MISLGDFAMLHEPTGTLGTKPDATHENERWDEGRAKLKAPSDVSSMLHDDIRAKAQEDSCEYS